MSEKIYKPIKKKTSTRTSTDGIEYYANDSFEMLLFNIVLQAVKDLRPITTNSNQWDSSQKLLNRESAFLFFLHNDFMLSEKTIEQIMDNLKIRDEWERRKIEYQKTS